MKSIHIDEFNNFMNCPIEELEARVNGNSKGLNKKKFKTHREATNHYKLLDSLYVKKMIFNLRKGKITREQFDEEVILRTKV